MTRPKGSKNKPKEVDRIEIAREELQKIADQTIHQPNNHPHIRPPIRYDAIFGVRFLRKDSQFPGLWELVKLDGSMNRVKVITDANARGQVMVLLMREVKRIAAIA